MKWIFRFIWFLWLCIYTYILWPIVYIVFYIILYAIWNMKLRHWRKIKCEILYSDWQEVTGNPLGGWPGTECNYYANPFKYLIKEPSYSF